MEEALGAVTKDRNVDYGDPEDNFQDIAEYWQLYIKQNFGVYLPLRNHDVALMADLMKTARIKTSPHKMDHWVDKAGYSACGFRCVAMRDLEK